MQKYLNWQQGFTLFRSISTMVFGIIAILGIFVVLHTSENSSTVTTTKPIRSTTQVTPSNPYAILSPAIVASKTAECSQAVVYTSDGNSGPITCSNGNLNILEWNALATLEPTLMTLGYSATQSQVQAAMCKDANDSSSDANTKYSNVIETTTYQISVLYYGWSFSSDPTAVLSDGGC